MEKVKKNSSIKKILTLLLVFLMVFTMMPGMVWAETGRTSHGYLKNITIYHLSEGDASYTGFHFESTESNYDMPIAEGMTKLKVYKSGNAPEDLKCHTEFYNETNKMWVTSNQIRDCVPTEAGAIINLMPLIGTNASLPVGQSKKIRVIVGVPKEDGSFTENDCDIYYFLFTRKVSLKSLSVCDQNGKKLELNPSKLSCNTEYYSVQGKDLTSVQITGTLQTATDTEIWVNNKKIENGKAAEVNVEICDKNNDGFPVIPIEAKYVGTGEVADSIYNLVIDNTDYSPAIKTQPAEITCCGKEENVKISVEAQQPDKGVLSYQWYKVNPGSEFRTAIKDATEASYDAPTTYAGETIYCCDVINTVNGVQYIAVSDTAKVIVQATYASAPVIDIFEAFGTQYRVGEDAAWLNIKASALDQGVEVSYQWYKNTKASQEGATPVTGVWNPNGSGNIGMVCTPDTTEEGEFYYFCVVTSTVTTPDNLKKSESTVSKMEKITVTDIELPLEGKGTERDPYLIKNAEDMNTLRNIINNGEPLQGKHIRLENDITLSEDWNGMGCVKPETPTDPNLGYQIPCGSSVNPFAATFDGNGKTITIPDGCPGLIRYARTATVKNLNIQGVNIKGSAVAFESFIDYGKDDNYQTGVPKTITVENVVLKSGSKTTDAGLVKGSGSGSNIVTVRNCIVEENVDVKNASFVGELNGSINNCKSYAHVTGAGFVGGIAGCKGQSMGICSIINCEFYGSVEASGAYVGGIMGAGYADPTAPNTPVVSIQNCLVAGNVTGRDCVGGIFGGEPVCEDCWDNGKGTISDNVFFGQVRATSEKAFIGGIIGFMKSYNHNQSMNCNFYLDSCGTNKGIGAVEIVNVENFDLTKCGTPASESEMKNGTVVRELNTSSSGFKNWEQGPMYPLHTSTPIAYELTLSGDYKIEYKTGDTFSTDGMVITVKLSDGSTRIISLSDEKLKFTGFKSNQRGVQTITVTYGVAKATYDVTVLYNESQVQDISVYFTLLGDTKHDTPTAATGTHTLSAGNLQTWIPRTKVEIDNNTTVYDVFKQVLTANNVTWRESAKLGTVYIESLNKDGVDLGEFDNGNLSGWMYTLNGTHPLLGVAQQFLNNGDNIVFHYTDDYTKEEGSEHWSLPEEAKEVTTTGTSGSATTTAPTEVTVSGNTATASVKKENVEAVLKQAKENKSTEIVLNVAASDTKGAETVKIQLDTATVKSIVADTSASITVKTENGQVSFDREALTTVASEAKGTTITLEVVTVSKPTETQQKAAGTNGQVLQLVVKSGDKIISDFNKGKATVTVEIPSKLKDKKVAAIHIAEDGKIEQMSGKTVKIDGKDYYTFGTPHFSAFALVDADELGLEAGDEDANIERIKELVSDMSLKARSSKTYKKNIKVTLTVDKSTAAAIKEIKDMGYTVKYKYYRSTKKASKYQAKITKTTRSFTNTAGKKGTRYYYKARIQVYDKDGNLVAQTLLTQCKYAARTWTK